MTHGLPLRGNGQKVPGNWPAADVVLRLIWEERRISRAEIARRTGYSRSTVSEVMGDLLAGGLVAEAGTGPSRGGRRPIELEFQDDAGRILGVEMGGAHVGVLLTDLRGREVAWAEEEHAVRDDPDGTRALIARMCHELREADGPSRPLLGLGVALPCPIDPRRPGTLSRLVLPAWDGEVGLEALADELAAPLYLDNDANLGALAERWWGAGQGVEDFVYVKLGTGVGAGHIIAGRIYRGAAGVAGEIGHLSIDPNGPRCLCGLRGCLATLVGSPALRERAARRLVENPASSLRGPRPGIMDIEDAALAGDALALEIVQGVAEPLGRAIAGLLNIMNPSLIVLGGGLTRLGDLLLDPLREMVQQRTLVSAVSASELRIGELGKRTVALGAATLVLEAALENPRNFPSRLRALEEH